MLQPTSCSWLEQSQRVTLEMTSLAMLVGEGVFFFRGKSAGRNSQKMALIFLHYYYYFLIIFENTDGVMTAKLSNSLTGWLVASR